MLFSNQRQINPFDPPVTFVIEVLIELVDRDLGYSSVNTARSAISSLVSLTAKSSLSENILLKRFMR